MNHTFTRNMFAVILLSFLSNTTAFSQNCVIDTNNYALLSPPSDQLPCVVRNTPYSLTLQLFCPPSFGGGITIDSIKVTNFPGMPSGLVKSSNPTSGTMYPLGRMCIEISGTTTDTVGYYDIIYNGTAYTSAGNAPFSYLRTAVPGSLPDYGLSVINPGDACSNTDTVATSVKQVNSATDVFSIFPNPTIAVFTFTINADQKLNGEIRVSDVTGRNIYSQIVPAVSFFQASIDLSRFSKGVYFVQFKTVQGINTKKIFKQ